MKELPQAVLNELDLDYTVTLFSSGESGTCEIVMWGRPHDNHFSLELRLPLDAPTEAMETGIREQLKQRLAQATTGPTAVQLGAS